MERKDLVLRAGVGGMLEAAIGIRGIKIAKYLRLRARMAVGQEPFTALNDLDKQLVSFLPSSG
jgi:hypothetical protein